MDMTFAAFCELYERDRRPRLKESTWQTKENIIKNKVIPAFGKRIISEIDTKDIIAWQNELLAYRDEQKKPYSNTYLKVIHNQMVSILNHAVRHYGLKSNPASKVGYAPFSQVPAERILCPEVIGITDSLATQVRNAAYQVGIGAVTIDEAVSQYGSF
jgi:hypothetical protein